MPRVFIGVGSNEGDRFSAISSAIQLLSASSSIRVIQMAPIIETQPVGGPPQEDYLNTVVELETGLSANDLLVFLKSVEQKLGRHAGPRWGPRPIDLDILLYGDAVIRTPELEIPHPLMHDRMFVLEPLAQLAPDLIHPVIGSSIAQLLLSAGSKQSKRACSK